MNDVCDVCLQNGIECQYLEDYNKNVCWDCITEGFFTEEDFNKWIGKSTENTYEN